MESKYKKGDKVFSAESNYIEKSIGCPDCLGTLKWIITFADGESKEVECQTCTKDYRPSGYIRYHEYTPKVSEVTIGSIKYDDTRKCPFEYMCVETGIGSGRVYQETDLFTVFEDAKVMAEKKNQEIMKNIAGNNFSPKFSKRGDIEAVLSTFGFTRRQAVEKARNFRAWALVSGVVKKKK